LLNEKLDIFHQKKSTGKCNNKIEWNLVYGFQDDHLCSDIIAYYEHRQVHITG